MIMTPTSAMRTLGLLAALLAPATVHAQDDRPAEETATPEAVAVNARRIVFDHGGETVVIELRGDRVSAVVGDRPARILSGDGSRAVWGADPRDPAFEMREVHVTDLTLPRPRANLGVVLDEAGEILASQLGIPATCLVVRELRPGSPAERAGILRHDVLIRLAGGDWITRSSLAAELDRRRPGERIDLHLLRGGDHHRVLVPLGGGELPAGVPLLSDVPVIGELFRRREGAPGAAPAGWVRTEAPGASAPAVGSLRSAESPTATRLDALAEALENLGRRLDRIEALLKERR